MFRVIALLAGLSSVVAPALLAQNQSLCVFQQKQGHSADVDAGFDSSLLTKELTAKIPAAMALSVVPISGFSSKEIEAEAQRRGCNWVVTLWRDQLGPDSPNYGGTLGNTQQTTGKGSQLWIKGTKLGGDTLLEYSLRKADAHKAIAHGEGEEESTYAKFAESIVKKIEKEK
ncbi:MAG TPA: hypothetical protein VHE33_02915 [Acidobacteriaceae bacterium]|jgi:hypothetical protein|nr:hypothetical protein [Acidobacteriaceae bacterium]